MNFEQIQKTCIDTLASFPFCVEVRDVEDELRGDLMMNQIEINLLFQKLKKRLGVETSDFFVLGGIKSVKDLIEYFWALAERNEGHPIFERQPKTRSEKSEEYKLLHKLLSKNEDIRKKPKEEEKEELPFTFVPNPLAEEKTILTFPGQGSQFVGMAKDLVEKYPQTRIYFDIAKKILGYDLLKICLEGPEELLSSTEVSQPAIFVCSIASLVKLNVEYPDVISNCVATAGLSLGEYTSLCFSGALSFEDTLKIIKVRAELMQKASNENDTSMLSLLGENVNESNVMDLINHSLKITSGKVKIANYLSEGNIVLSGNTNSILEVQKQSSKFNITKSVILKVSGAFHSEFMENVSNKLNDVIENIKFNTPLVPIITNLDANFTVNPIELRKKIIEEITNPVQWEKTVKLMLSMHNTLQKVNIIECGCGSVLTNITKRMINKNKNKSRNIKLIKC